MAEKIMKTENRLVQTIADYFSTKNEAFAVYLFGSYAHGSPRPTSDVDVGILFESREHSFISAKIDAYNLALTRMLRKDLHLVALNFASELLLKQIFSKGRCILVNNPKQLAAFQMISFAKIADFGYYKTTLQKGFARKLLQD